MKKKISLFICFVLFIGIFPIGGISVNASEEMEVLALYENGKIGANYGMTSVNTFPTSLETNITVGGRPIFYSSFDNGKSGATPFEFFTNTFANDIENGDPQNGLTLNRTDGKYIFEAEMLPITVTNRTTIIDYAFYGNDGTEIATLEFTRAAAQTPATGTVNLSVGGNQIASRTFSTWNHSAANIADQDDADTTAVFYIKAEFDFSESTMSFWVVQRRVGGAGNEYTETMPNSEDLLVQDYEFSNSITALEKTVCTSASGPRWRRVGFTFMQVSFLSDVSAVAKAKDLLTFDVIKGRNTSENTIYYNLNLPEVFEECAIDWESSEPSIISDDGELLKIPDMPAPVELTAAITKRLVKDTITFSLMVPATDSAVIQPESDRFDKYILSEENTDLTIDVNLNDANELVGLYNVDAENRTALIPEDDYLVVFDELNPEVIDKVIIKKEYLETLPIGYTYIEFEVDKGRVPQLKITVFDHGSAAYYAGDRNITDYSGYGFAAGKTPEGAAGIKVEGMAGSTGLWNADTIYANTPNINIPVSANEPWDIVTHTFADDKTTIGSDPVNGIVLNRTDSRYIYEAEFALAQMINGVYKADYMFFGNDDKEIASLYFEANSEGSATLRVNKTAVPGVPPKIIDLKNINSNYSISSNSAPIFYIKAEFDFKHHLLSLWLVQRRSTDKTDDYAEILPGNEHLIVRDYSFDDSIDSLNKTVYRIYGGNASYKQIGWSFIKVTCTPYTAPTWDIDAIVYDEEDISLSDAIFISGVSIKRPTIDTEAAKLIVAQYDDEFALLNVYSTDIPKDIDQNPEDIVIPVDVGLVPGVKKVKVFLWKDYDNLLHLCNSKTFE